MIKERMTSRDKYQTMVSVMMALAPQSYKKDMLKLDGLALKVRDICSLFDVDPPMISNTKSAKLKVIEARQVIMFLLRHETSLSLSDIGKCLGFRDHATVLHSVKRVGILFEVDRSYRSVIIALGLHKYLDFNF